MKCREPARRAEPLLVGGPPGRPGPLLGVDLGPSGTNSSSFVSAGVGFRVETLRSGPDPRRGDPRIANVKGISHTLHPGPPHKWGERNSCALPTCEAFRLLNWAGTRID